MNVLVTDGENRSALAVTRSLGKKGCTVFIAGLDAKNISSSSAFCRKNINVPNPLTDGENYSQEIARIVNEENIDVIFPMTEQSVYCLNKYRDQLGENVILACAPSEKMEAVSNKSRLFQLAEELEVDIPATIYVSDADNFFEKKNQISVYPVVVKPAFSKIQDGDEILSTSVMYAANYSELNRLYETTPALRYPSMIQEMIMGEGTGLFTLFDQDKHLALFSHRRILEKPPSGGVSVLSESVALDYEMVEAARKLLSEVRWTGIAMVEFKRDLRDGRAKLMEINGRFWGSLQLAISSGIDFPALCLEYYLGRKPTSVMSNYLVGHKLKWFFGMLDHLFIRMKTRNRSQLLPSGTPTVWQVGMELLNYGGVDTSPDVYDAGDLKPFATESKAYIKSLLRLKG